MAPFAAAKIADRIAAGSSLAFDQLLNTVFLLSREDAPQGQAIPWATYGLYVVFALLCAAVIVLWR